MGFRAWNMYDYFVWLCIKVDATDEFGLMEKLHDREFTWSNNGNLIRDENRADAAKHLRRIFLDNKCVPDIYGDMLVPASVLEVLVALAIDTDDKLAGDGSGDRVPIYFHEMIENLGIYKNPDKLEYILDRWLNRDFEWDGTGSPFPIHRGCKYDQRKVELWLQACGYFSQELR